MKNNKKNNKRNIDDLKKLKLFGDSEKDLKDEDFDSLKGGKKDTTVDTHWPTGPVNDNEK